MAVNACCTDVSRYVTVRTCQICFQARDTAAQHVGLGIYSRSQVCKIAQLNLERLQSAIASLAASSTASPTQSSNLHTG